MLYRWRRRNIPAHAETNQTLVLNQHALDQKLPFKMLTITAVYEDDGALVLWKVAALLPRACRWCNSTGRRARTWIFIFRKIKQTLEKRTNLELNF